MSDSGTTPGSRLYRLAAFTRSPHGGNPAGVWVGPELPDAAIMQRVAKEVGYSETVFLGLDGPAAIPTRYFSPEVEVPFCGHATIAAGCTLGQLRGAGQYVLQTQAGDVPVRVDCADGIWTATLTSVTPRHEPPGSELEAVLGALAWDVSELDDTIPPARAYAGAWHLVIAVRSAERLANMHYDFDRMKQIMLDAGLTTLQLIWRERPAREGLERERPDLFHARNPFPVGGVVEDPATGAAAAALGGYLRDSGRLTTPAYFLIRQGEAMGRPSLIHVRVPETGGVEVTGTAISFTNEDP